LIDGIHRRGVTLEPGQVDAGEHDIIERAADPGQNPQQSVKGAMTTGQR
jgi:hypothetical protein